MPFDYEEYKMKCDGLTTDELHREWENYTRQMAGGATSTATSVLFSPFTAGISLVGIGLSAPRIHNARKKREIIQAGLEARGETHNTRKRDVIAPMAVAGTLSGLTLGLAGPGADFIAGAVVGHGAEYAAAHVALDSTGAVLEHKHDKHSHEKAHQKLQAQYQSSKTRYGQQHRNSSAYFPLSTVFQPGCLPLDQPQPPAQDQKYEFVPAPTPQHPSIAYRPSLHQQIFVQQAADPSNEPPSIRTSRIPSPDPRDFPSGRFHIAHIPVGITVPSSNKLDSESDKPVHATMYELDSTAVVSQQADISPVPEITMEQEISILKARILQMEIEKRQGPIKNMSSEFDPAQPMPQSPSGRSEISQIQLGPLEPDVQITPALASFTEHQNYPQPPASLSPSITSPVISSPQYTPISQTPIHDFFLPPPPPRPHSAHIPQNYPPPPPPVISTENNQQQFYSPPLPDRPQQQPQIQRQDSGYYSIPPSRHSSAFSTATISTCSSPQQLLSPQGTGYPLLSPQATGQSKQALRHSVSHGSIVSGQVSPMSSQTAPYFPPPPSSATGALSKGKDLFAQNFAKLPPHIPVYQPGMGPPAYTLQQPYQGTQGWQWRSAPMKSQGEPDYGAPPPIPTAWKRS